MAAHRCAFLDAMDDDFNTGGATAALFDLVRRLNKFMDDEKLEDSAGANADAVAAVTRGATTLRELGATLGLFRQPIEEKSAGDGLVDGLMGLVIEIRASARKNKDFATADRIRDTLGKLGVTLEDRPGGTEWSR
ncbi:MAG: hypothetical protein NTW96_15300 [Planctomycetia bacterium]|nr:hypothetical protein [Planctomycetia bacterium]